MESPDQKDETPTTEVLLDVIEELLGWLRVGTFDEEPGERKAADRARELLVRFRRG
jgi:hypothetical protein